MKPTHPEARPRSPWMVALVGVVVLLAVAVAVLAVRVVRLDERERQTRCELHQAVAALARGVTSTPEEIVEAMRRGCTEHEIFDL